MYTNTSFQSTTEAKMGIFNLFAHTLRINVLFPLSFPGTQDVTLETAAKMRIKVIEVMHENEDVIPLLFIYLFQFSRFQSLFTYSHTSS